MKTKNLLSLEVIDFTDVSVGVVINAAATPITTSVHLEVVASLADTVHAIKVMDTIGRYIGLYSGASGSEELRCVLGLGENQPLGIHLNKGDRISLMSLDGSTADEGKLCVQFLG